MLYNNNNNEKKKKKETSNKTKQNKNKTQKKKIRKGFRVVFCCNQLKVVGKHTAVLRLNLGMCTQAEAKRNVFFLKYIRKNKMKNRIKTMKSKDGEGRIYRLSWNIILNRTKRNVTKMQNKMKIFKKAKGEH